MILKVIKLYVAATFLPQITKNPLNWNIYYIIRILKNLRDNKKENLSK